MARNIDAMKTGWVDKNGGFSGTHRTSYIRTNPNVYRPELLSTICYEIPYSCFSGTFENPRTHAHTSPRTIEIPAHPVLNSRSTLRTRAQTHLQPHTPLDVSANDDNFFVLPKYSFFH